jgi:2-(1,2-epoxy-1,2-dihydrophenyl)acetyl-CoA isomerase
LDEDTRRQVDFGDLAQKKLGLKLWRLYKPGIAAINGLTVGGGFTIPLACADLIYAYEHAWVRLPFARLGLVPELASSYPLPRLIGFQRAKELFFFGEDLSAQRLLELGLINDVLPHSELLPRARRAALRLISPEGAPQAIRMSKEIMHRPLIEAVSRALDLENEALLKAFGTSDFFEAINARKAGRPPVFRGR